MSYFLNTSSVLSFYKDVILTLSIGRQILHSTTLVREGHLVLICMLWHKRGQSAHRKNDINPAIWRSWSVTVFFICARNIVFKHKINLCVDVEHTVCVPCVWLWFICVSFKITHINIGSVCAYFELTLLSSTWWTQNSFKSAHREDKKFLNTRYEPIS